MGLSDGHVAARSATWHISGSVLTAIFAAVRTPMTARVKPYAAARGSITPLRISFGLFAASTAPAITGQVPGETDMFVPVIPRAPPTLN